VLMSDSGTARVISANNELICAFDRILVRNSADLFMDS
jgi:hypothetical protein